MTPARTLAGCTIVLLATMQATAGTFTLTPSFVARYDDDFQPLPFDRQSGDLASSGAAIYQLDFNFQVGDLAANEQRFADTAFDIHLLGGFQDVLGWTTDVSGIGSNPTAGRNAGANYLVNMDAGKPGDLQGVLAALPVGVLPAGDPRATLGQQQPAYLGSIFLRWDGISPAGVSVRNIQYSFADSQGNFLDVQNGARKSLLYGLEDDPLPPPPAPPAATPVVSEPPPVSTPPQEMKPLTPPTTKLRPVLVPPSRSTDPGNPDTDPQSSETEIAVVPSEAPPLIEVIRPDGNDLPMPVQWGELKYIVDTPTMEWMYYEDGILRADNPTTNGTGEIMVPTGRFNSQVIGRATTDQHTLVASQLSSLQIADVGAVHQETMSAPEPRSIVLAGLALVGLVGFARRRRG
jgi:hypothetical protein